MKHKKVQVAGLALLVLLLVLAVVFFFVLAPMLAKRFNPVLRHAPYASNAAAADLHQRLLIVDLHADALLWPRDLLQHGMPPAPASQAGGHVDVPRLIEGNVALQAFTIVTKMPRNPQLENNGDDTDNITPLALASRWPLRSWSSLTERALVQAAKLQEAAARSQGRLSLIRSRADLAAYLQRREQEPHITAGFLGVEGAHALEGNLANIDRLYDAGVRMMAPTHFFDNDIAGSLHGQSKAGLSRKGQEMIRRMEAKHMLLDLAHASPRTVSDALAIATRPVLVSHTGVKGTCNNARNLSDEQLRAIARKGGVVGIGYWQTAVCGTDAAAVARAIIYASRLIGAQHVALGSDFDGAVAMPFDTAGLVLITQALQQRGMSEADIRLVMGGSALRLLRENLP